MILNQINHTVDFYELLTACGITVGGIVGAWINMRVNVTELKQELKYLQKELEEEKQGNKANLKLLSDKIDLLITAVNELKVELAQKTK